MRDTSHDWGTMARNSVAQALEYLDNLCEEKTPTPTPTPAPRWLGTNLAQVCYWNTSWPFQDWFKLADEWLMNKDWAPAYEMPPHLDEDGWISFLEPSTYASTLLLREPPNYPGGKYNVYHHGTGRLWYGYAAQKVVEESITGMDVIDVQPNDQGIGIGIMETDPDDPVRYIEIYGPTHEPENDPMNHFRDQFKARLRGYGTFRYMDWMVTNWSKQAKWEDRPKVEDATWATSKGVPLDLMISLANEMNANPWFCIPHMADDEYVRQFAYAVASGLNSEQKVYIEYSNEVWNGGFSQADWCRDNGKEIWPYESDTIAREWYYALRSMEIFKIFEDVFCDNDRLVRVIGTQAANAGVTEHIMGVGGVSEHTDAIAIAPYFGAEGIITASTTLDVLFDDLRIYGVPRAIGTMKTQKKLADEYGMKLIAYEGGQHLRAANKYDKPVVDLFKAANADPRMGELYKTYLDAWRDISGDGVFCHFNDCEQWGKSGCWGSEPFSGAGGPKWDALKAYREES